MLLLDGKKVRDEIAKTLRRKIAAFSSPPPHQTSEVWWGGKPTLAIIQVGDNKESAAYIKQKKLFSESIGARVEHFHLPVAVSKDEVIQKIIALNRDSNVRGIILQLPLPPYLDRQKLINAIVPKKDIDGLTSTSVAARKEKKPDAFVPATARGVLELLQFYHIPIHGRRSAVLGRSALVGAPVAEALRNAGAEVTVCHRGTPNTKEITRASDIVVVAIGKPRLIGADYFRGDRTQAVVDVGITAVTETGTKRLEEEIPKRRLVGDVDFAAVKDMVAAISPVPGGVGPMTVAALFENLVDSMV